MSDKIIVDGDLVESSCVSLEVTSPGLAYGFGLFETIKFKGRRPCFFEEHFDRLQRAANAANIGFDYSIDEMRSQSRALFDANQVDDGIFKIVVTESGSRFQTIVFVRDAELKVAKDPLRVRVSNVMKASNAFTSRHKTLNYMENWLELQAAREHGFDECLFSNELGHVTEGALSNAFFIKDGVLKTASLECGLLDGVIRGQLLRIAEEDGWLVEEGAFGIEEFTTADEAFMSSSGKNLISISEIQTNIARAFPVVGSKRVEQLSARLNEAEDASLEGK